MPRKSSKADSKTAWPRYRTKHRERSHQASHAAQGESLPPLPAFDHSLVCDDGPRLIATQEGLGQLITTLRSAGGFGYDSEFIGEHSYFPQLCVIQVATPNQIALIDPLAEEETLDLTPFWELLADPRVEKIVHAGMPDLEPVVRHLKKPPRAIFDTQIAAAFASDATTTGAGLTYPMALGKLLHEITGLDLMPSSRSVKFSQWDHRPLSEAQLKYAANDVRYLPLMRHLLVERIEACGNMARAIEEFQSLSEGSLYVFDPQAQRVRARGIEKLSRRQREVLRALIIWRDAAAREHDVPIRSLLRDDVLFALAGWPVASKQDLKRVSGLPRPVEREYGQTIIDITRAAMKAPLGDEDDAGEKPRRSRRAEEASSQKADRRDNRRRVDELWLQIEQQCRNHHIHPAIVTSKRELDDIVYAAARGQPECASPTEHRLCSGWRRELVGHIVQPHVNGPAPGVPGKGASTRTAD